MLYVLACSGYALQGAYLNGEQIRWRDYGRFAIPSEGVLSVSVPSRARAASLASVAGRLDPAKDYLLILWGYNGRRTPTVFTTDPPDHEPLGLGGVEKVIWQYADSHGMCLGWLGRIKLPTRVKMSITGHHDHSWQRFVVEVDERGVTLTERDHPWVVPAL